MKVNQMTAVIRPRNPWEAIDLGFRMARAWWKPIFATWFAVTLPIFILINALSFEALWLVPWLMWWLKPLFDRVPLHLLSRALFGDTPAVATVVKAAPKLMSGYLFSALLFYRLTPVRSFSLPVWQLEGLRGKARRDRANVLNRGSSNAAGWLTLVCVHMEWFLFFGVVTLVYMAMPQGVDVDVFDWLFTEEVGTFDQLIQNSLAYLAMSVIEPFYVAAGFALYLNRRSSLEAWDIELAFRRLAQRLDEESPGGEVKSRPVAAMMVGISLLMSLMAFSPDGMATPSGQGVLEGYDSTRPVVDEVLAEPDFKDYEMRKVWRYVGERDQNTESKPPGWLNGLGDFFTNLAKVLEFFLWIAVAGIAVYAIYWIINYKSKGERVKPLDLVPEVIFGLDVRPESLPDDVAAEAWRQWQAGNAAGAVSLLYRGALVHLVGHHALPLHDGSTEGECLGLVRALGDEPRSDYFRHLTLTWQGLAYGHRTPQEGDVRLLCDHWSNHFTEPTP